MSNKCIITAMPFIEEASPGEFNVVIPQEVIDDFIKNFKKTKNTIVGEMSHNDKTLI